METVIETPAYLSSAKAEGMTEAEMFEAVTYVSNEPEAGVMIVGSGGCRKVRLAGKGKGKSGGYRAVTVYAPPRGVFLIAVLSKGSRANFSQAQVNAMAALVKRLKAGAA